MTNIFFFIAGHPGFKKCSFKDQIFQINDIIYITKIKLFKLVIIKTKIYKFEIIFFSKLWKKKME